MRLEKKIAIITGAGQGIGRGIAHRFAAEGAHVVIAEQNLETATRTATEIRDQHGTVDVEHLDVADEGAVESMVQRVVARHGRLDILINNAAVEVYEPFMQISLDSWKRHLDTDLTSCFICGQAAARQMMGQGGGRIIHMASINSFGAEVGLAHYAAAKGGVAQLTRAMAVDLARYNILVNAIAPGPIATEKTTSIFAQEEFQPSMARILLGRPGTAAEVAAVAVFLASDEASFVHGTVVVVDGGYLAGL